MLIESICYKVITVRQVYRMPEGGILFSDTIDREGIHEETDILLEKSKIYICENNAGHCIECKFHTLCRGGCRRNREFDVAKGEYANYYCESYRFFFEQCLEKMIHIVETIKR